MSTMKDKLSASVRQAKSAQQTDSKKPAQPAAKRAAPGKAVARPATAKPVVSKAAATPKPAAKPAAAPGIHAGGIPDSATTLHPQRVWPD
ncbi:MAG: hypothetical protein ACK4R8_10190 [Thiobacillus sp.]